MMTSTTDAANAPAPDIFAPHRQIDVGARYIPGFDGIRAIAVLFVLVSHSGFGDLVPGALGMTIFFAILHHFPRADAVRRQDEEGADPLAVLPPGRAGLVAARRLLRGRSAVRG